MGNVKKVPVKYFIWFEKLYQLNEDLIEIYNEDTDIGCLIEVSVQYHENLHKIHNEFTLFVWKKESWKKNEKKSRTFTW